MSGQGVRRSQDPALEKIKLVRQVAVRDGMDNLYVRALDKSRAPNYLRSVSRKQCLADLEMLSSAFVTPFNPEKEERRKKMLFDKKCASTVALPPSEKEVNQFLHSFTKGCFKHQAYVIYAMIHESTDFFIEYVEPAIDPDWRRLARRIKSSSRALSMLGSCIVFEGFDLGIMKAWDSFKSLMDEWTRVRPYVSGFVNIIEEFCCMDTFHAILAFGDLINLYKLNIPYLNFGYVSAIARLLSTSFYGKLLKKIPMVRVLFEDYVNVEGDSDDPFSLMDRILGIMKQFGKDDVVVKTGAVFSMFFSSTLFTNLGVSAQVALAAFRTHIERLSTDCSIVTMFLEIGVTITTRVRKFLTTGDFLDLLGEDKVSAMSEQLENAFAELVSARRAQIAYSQFEKLHEFEEILKKSLKQLQKPEFSKDIRFVSAVRALNGGLVSFKNQSSSIAAAPLGFILTGEPGLGKTWLVNEIALSTKFRNGIDMNVEVTTEWKELKYQKVAPIPMVLHYNDAFSTLDRATETDMLGLLQSFVENVAVDMDTASLEEKAMSKAHYESVFISTNAKHYTFVKVHNGTPSKLVRRYRVIDFVMTEECKVYCDANGITYSSYMSQRNTTNGMKFEGVELKYRVGWMKPTENTTLSFSLDADREILEFNSFDSLTCWINKSIVSNITNFVPPGNITEGRCASCGSVLSGGCDCAVKVIPDVSEDAFSLGVEGAGPSRGVSIDEVKSPFKNGGIGEYTMQGFVKLDAKAMDFQPQWGLEGATELEILLTYEILHLEPGADKESILRARKLVMTWYHPDKFLQWKRCMLDAGALHMSDSMAKAYRDVMYKATERSLEVLGVHLDTPVEGSMKSLRAFAWKFGIKIPYMKPSEYEIVKHIGFNVIVSVCLFTTSYFATKGLIRLLRSETNPQGNVLAPLTNVPASEYVNVAGFKKTKIPPYVTGAQEGYDMNVLKIKMATTGYAYALSHEVIVTDYHLLVSYDAGLTGPDASARDPSKWVGRELSIFTEKDVFVRARTLKEEDIVFINGDLVCVYVGSIPSVRMGGLNNVRTAKAGPASLLRFGDHEGKFEINREKMFVIDMDVSVAGDCGRVYHSMDRDEEVVTAMHFAKMSNYFSRKQVAIPLIREDLEKAFDLFASRGLVSLKPTEMIREEYKVHFQGLKPVSKPGDMAYVLEKIANEDKPFLYDAQCIGKLPFRDNATMTGRRSVLYDYFSHKVSSEYIPPWTGHAKESAGFKSPYTERYADKGVYPSDTSFVDVGFDRYLEDVPVPSISLHPMTFEQSVCGDHRNRLIGAMRDDTSMGPLHKLQGLVKSELFKLGEFGTEIHKEVYFRVEQILQAVKAGEREFLVCQATLKDELLKEKKVNEDGKGRLFWVIEKALIIVTNMYFKSPIAWLTQNWLTTGFVTAINPGGKDWTLLAGKHKRIGKRSGDTDFKRYDGSHTWMLEALIPGLIKLLKKLGYTHDEAVEAIRVYRMCTQGCMLIEGFVLFFFTRMTSGTALTMFINNLINQVLWRSFMMQREKNCVFFLSTCGDDFLLTIDDASSLSLEEYRLWLLPLGYTMTSADKKIGALEWKFLEECTFLKRSFVQAGDLWKAPLDEESIYKSMSYVVGKMKLGSAEEAARNQNNFYCMLKESVLHGEDFFMEFSACGKAAGLSPSEKTYSDYLQAWEEDRLIVWEP